MKAQDKFEPVLFSSFCCLCRLNGDDDEDDCTKDLRGMVMMMNDGGYDDDSGTVKIRLFPPLVRFDSGEVLFHLVSFEGVGSNYVGLSVNGLGLMQRA